MRFDGSYLCEYCKRNTLHVRQVRGAWVFLIGFALAFFLSPVNLISYLAGIIAAGEAITPDLNMAANDEWAGIEAFAAFFAGRSIAHVISLVMGAILIIAGVVTMIVSAIKSPWCCQTCGGTRHRPRELSQAEVDAKAKRRLATKAAREATAAKAAAFSDKIADVWRRATAWLSQNWLRIVGILLLIALSAGIVLLVLYFGPVLLA